jgi:hypothetical protein
MILIIIIKIAQTGKFVKDRFRRFKDFLFFPESSGIPLFRKKDFDDWEKVKKWVIPSLQQELGSRIFPNAKIF